MTKPGRAHGVQTTSPARADTLIVSKRKPLRWRGLTLGLLLAIAPVATACTPQELEASFQRMAVSFEEGGAERGLAEAIFVLDHAIPIINMRLSRAFGS